PAAACGLVGLKTSRGRVAMDPPDHWYGLSVAGCVSRGVLDSALWLDAVAAQRPERPFVESAGSLPGKLRIALSAKPGVLGVRVKNSVRTAVHETAQVLRSLGHEVTERDPAYGDMRPPFTPRWLRGIRDDAAAMPDPGQLEARTRSESSSSAGPATRRHSCRSRRSSRRRSAGWIAARPWIEARARKSPRRGLPHPSTAVPGSVRATKRKGPGRAFTVLCWFIESRGPQRQHGARGIWRIGDVG